jgi:AcrR family transcriptional regulator
MAENGRPADDDGPLILALVAGMSVSKAAERAGVGERTVYRRLADADFRQAVSEARGRLFDAALGKLANIATKAAGTLERLMDSDKPSVALGAAKAALELGPRLRELTELEDRLSRLEGIAKGNQHANQQAPATYAGNGY